MQKVEKFIFAQYAVIKNNNMDEVHEYSTPSLLKITYTLLQEGNTEGTTALDEILEVDIIGPFDIFDEGGFMVIKSTTGWSVNDSEELYKTLKKLEKGVPSYGKETNQQ